MVVDTRYVDVNVFVYWLGKHPVFGETAYRWVKDIERAPRGEYVTSSLTIYEVMVIIAGLSRRSLEDFSFVSSILEAFTGLGGLAVEELSIEDFSSALELMDKFKIDFEDALHAAISMRLNIREIVSNDEDFDKTPLKRIF